MDTIQDLLKTADISDIYDNTAYPFLKEISKEYYTNILEEFLSKTALPNDEKMAVVGEKIPSSEDFPESINISVFSTLENEKISLSFIDWDTVAGFDVMIQDIPQSEFILSFLYELSFYGSEETMKKTRDELFDSEDDE